MARGMSPGSPLTPLLIVLACTALHGSRASQFPTSLIIKEWVDQMQQELVSLADTASAGKSLVEIFMNNTKYYTVEPNNAGRLVENAAWNIENFLKKRAKALEVHRMKLKKLPPFFSFVLPYKEHIHVCNRVVLELITL
ncbi:voltage-dependent calcium channel subunit alpha-2/delta-1 isoform X1 [Tachysurus ichikawai]